MGLINAKEKRSRSGNWGHPNKFEKKNTKISNPLIPERVKYRSSKKYKKKKDRKPWDWVVCPFCKAELPKLSEEEIKKLEKGKFSVYFFPPRVKVCPSCGAKEVEDCPCCHRETWIDKEFTYKHQHNVYSCGFVGKSLQGLPLLDHPENRMYPELV